ncbi:hypothetical protein NKR23_g3511 [Pleurostoma richardsiae]|uniref:C2H2-type domain-containing protein n=1 Tax=Pleurostoma richardsiae TaxID=41990 RepID=A0AA38VWP4_9PEZI|nr:hypothetical protein NKR23_g3511 [Pleurostoma richardsiae]
MTQLSPIVLDKRRPQKRGSVDERVDGYARESRRPRTDDPARPCQGQTRRFACPFFVASPGSFKSNSTCAGRGWSEISRLKEHLYRRHYQRRISCDRCQKSFEHDRDLLAHRRQDEPCQRVEIKVQDPITQGMDDMAMNEIKSRKRPASMDDEEKWYDIWTILFPDVSLDLSSASSQASADIVASVHRFLQDQLPESICSAIQRDIMVISSVKQELDGLRSVISKCIDEALQQYTQSSNADSPSSPDQWSTVGAQSTMTSPIANFALPSAFPSMSAAGMLNPIDPLPLELPCLAESSPMPPPQRVPTTDESTTGSLVSFGTASKSDPLESMKIMPGAGVLDDLWLDPSYPGIVHPWEGSDIEGLYPGLMDQLNLGNIDYTFGKDYGQDIVFTGIGNAEGNH